MLKLGDQRHPSDTQMRASSTSKPHCACAGRWMMRGGPDVGVEMLLFHEGATTCMHVGSWHVSGRKILFPVPKQEQKQCKFRRSGIFPPWTIAHLDVTTMFAVVFRNKRLNSWLVIVERNVLVPPHTPRKKKTLDIFIVLAASLQPPLGHQRSHIVLSVTCL